MKRTAFSRVHVGLGAKMIEFAGFEMPVHYASIIEEHRCVRSQVGIFDVSHMGEILIEGHDALAFVQYLTTNDVSKLTKGKVQYSAMCYEEGGIVDDLLVYCLGDRYMLVVNAANAIKDLEWIKSLSDSFDVQIIDWSDDVSLLAVQGPRSIETLSKLTAVPLASMPYYSCMEGTLAEVDMMISRTGYTGELGFELYFDSSVSVGEKVWSAIMKAGAAEGIKPVGLGARDTLRLEMGYCLYGNDIDQATTPLEAGLGWITKLEKGPFSGRDALLRQKETGITRKLVGFVVTDDKAFPRHGYNLLAGGRKVGSVTSGTLSPVLEQGIGMGYVELNASEPGTPLQIGIRGRNVNAEVRRMPFVHQK